ncbi:MAG TPA: DinB family protein [Blastocatellia bacterium]|nr:DinB family protein [Blastocatellia bacterium]
MIQNILLFPDLARYYGQVEEIKQDAGRLVQGLTREQFNWCPEPGRWSIAECLEHLNITARLYFPLLIQTINEARANGISSQGPFRYSWLGNWFVRSAEPPPKIKFKAPKRYRPLPGLTISEVWPAFLVFQDRLLELINRANGVDLARVKIQLPTMSFIKLGLGQALGLITAHERRHLWQARQVKDHPNFPPLPISSVGRQPDAVPNLVRIR